MAEILLESQSGTVNLDIEHLVTEDDEPVDNIFSAKQQRLLVEPLYSSWRIEQPFLADANVGIFSTPYQPPIVPDMFLSLNAQVAEDWFAKQHRSYFLWEFGKPPEVTLEIVSNTKGEENRKKLQRYAELGIWYYAIYDPQLLIQESTLNVYELHIGEYILKSNWQLEKVDLTLTLWEGVFESRQGQWLRWCNLNGQVIPTGAERAEQERERADRLAAQLKALGIEPKE